MAIIGYARVSTQDQHLTGQLEALKLRKLPAREILRIIRDEEPRN